MNKARRKELEKAADLIYEAISIIEWCKDEEEDALENLPESIQMSEKGEEFDNNVYAMEECVDDLESVCDTLSEM